MFFLENLRLAFTALINNKMRSLLTMLGIIIGISSVITITTIGNSLRGSLSKTFNMLFDTSFYFRYNLKPDEDGDYNYDHVWTDDDYVNEEMLDRMEETFHGKYLPIMSESIGGSTVVNGRGQNIRVSVSGWSEGYAVSEANYFRAIKGSTVNDRDSEEEKHTVMVSDVFVQQYFYDGTDPIGKTIEVNIDSLCTTEFTVVGVYKWPEILEKHLQPGTQLMDRETMIIIPYGTALKLSGKKGESFEWVQITPADISMDMEEARRELQSFFDKEYKDKPDVQVTVTSDANQMEDVQKILNIVTAVVAAIAAISLIVGGIGVMNIMLVSITERTREIGVRKAIGAQQRTIRLQFVTEAVFMCLIGGIIGVLLGLFNGFLIGVIARYLLSTGFSDYADLVTLSIEPPMQWIVISLVFSMLTGIFFGSYPAKKAAQMNPIDALRYE